MNQVGVEKENVSAVMLFPCLKIKQELVNQFNEFGFINTYLFCNKREYDCNVIYLMFRPNEFTVGFHLFIQALERNINFLETIDEPSTVIIVYRVPPQFGADYLLFLNGAYSLTSPDFKACFQMKVYTKDDKGNLLKTKAGSYITEHSMYYHIFNKTDYLKNRWREALGDDVKLPNELYEKCSIEMETLVL